MVRTGMRADIGAVDEVKIRDGNIYVHVIGSHKEDSGSHEKNSGNHEDNSSGEEPQGNLRFRHHRPDRRAFPGRLDRHPRQVFHGKSPLIQERDNQLCVEYAPGLYFYQKDIDEFIRTKSAAHTMVEIMPVNPVLT